MHTAGVCRLYLQFSPRRIRCLAVLVTLCSKTASSFLHFFLPLNVWFCISCLFYYGMPMILPNNIFFLDHSEAEGTRLLLNVCKSLHSSQCQQSEIFIMWYDGRVQLAAAQAISYVHVYVCAGICVCVCVYVCMHAWMYICTYVHMHACSYVGMHASMCICMYACMHVCKYVRMYICMNACMYVCTYACMHVCTYICIYVSMYACT
jgi:hypothetical protein